MPTYLYHCDHCNKEFDRFCSITEYTKDPIAKHCGKKARRIIQGTMIMSNKSWGDAVATDGTDISSRTKQKEYMAKNDLVPYEPGMFDASIKKREEHYKTGGDHQARKETIKEVVNAKVG
jgi:putative FmdB family regulatory protein